MVAFLVLLVVVVLVVVAFPRSRHPCWMCGGGGRVNHVCGMVCVDDPCPECQE